jgi:serine/threonine protein kinase
VKYFHQDKHQYADVEKCTLDKVKSLGSSVPQVIVYYEDKEILVLDSVGISFVRQNAPRITRFFLFLFLAIVFNNLCRNLFCDLISVLESVHREHIIHRDLKIQNFFQRANDPNKVI